MDEVAAAGTIGRVVVGAVDRERTGGIEQGTKRTRNQALGVFEGSPMKPEACAPTG